MPQDRPLHFQKQQRDNTQLLHLRLERPELLFTDYVACYDAFKTLPDCKLAANFAILTLLPHKLSLYFLPNPDNDNNNLCVCLQSLCNAQYMREAD